MLRWQIRLPVVVALLVGVFFTVSIVKARLGALPKDLREIPLLNVETRVADLGKVRFGSRTDIAFRIENLGGKRVMIHEVDQECACGEPIRRSMTLDGQQTQDWVVNFDTAFQVGEVEKTWHFISSDPALPRFCLTVHGEVESPRNENRVDSIIESDSERQSEVFLPPNQ